MDNVLIIIPAYNEQGSLESVIRSIREYLPRKTDILVIDDGSVDNTRDVALKANVHIIELPYNMGIGVAVQTGLKYAVGHGYNLVIRVDADGQHLPGEINKLIDFLNHKEDCDMVIGSRYINVTDYQGVKIRKFAANFLSFFLSSMIKKKFTDVTSGFFALRKNAIKFLADNYPEDYPEVESIVLLVKNNFKIKEVPVDMTNRTSGSSSITFLNSIYYMIKVMLAILIFSFEKRKIEGNK